MTLLRSMLV